MGMANGYQAGVVDLLANHAQCSDQGFPSWVNVSGILEHWERRLEGCCQAVYGDGGEPQTVRAYRPRGEVSELDQILRSYVQDLAASVKFRDGGHRNCVRHVSPVGQPAQNASVDEHGHYS